ncbi:MAG TPA: glycosyltransferase family 39 protein [Kofleriaceae bacterium]|nr:glycosyltransferase family 39 protein [Kofleriaceae bacterium]
MRIPGQRVRRRLIAAALAVAALIAVLATQRHTGIARDEVPYMTSGAKYARWWIDFASLRDGTTSERRITDTFGGAHPTDNNREHPPLMKTLFGLSRILFCDVLGWASELTASRLPTAVLHAAAVAMIFGLGAQLWGSAAGLFAALLFLLMPRALFHAGLATFDAPMVALWLATLLAYHRSLASRWWSIGLAVAFGLALATKHNALMLPGVILPHYAWVAWRRSRVAVGDPAADPSSAAARPGRLVRLRGFVRALVRIQPFLVPALAVGGPLVLIAVWPWLWFDTVQHVRDWISFHTHHVHYNFEYLGENYNHPPFPWHVALVTTLFTVPVATLAAAVVGAAHTAARVRRGTAVDPDRAPVLLMALSAAVAMGVFLIPTTPIFGAEKHWAPAMPTFCLLAGAGIISAGDRVWRALVMRRWIPVTGGFARPAGAIAVGLLVASAALSETVAAQPYPLSSYNALAGGAPGGADLGMNRQFWGVAARGALPYLDEHVAPASGQPPVPVYTHDASPAWGLYRRLGLLRAGLPDAGGEERGVQRSRAALVIHERHFARHDIMIWREYGTVQPAFVLTFQGVPLVSVYLRPPPLRQDVGH